MNQAEALYFAGGAGFTLAAYNSSFYSNQDTIQTSLGDSSYVGWKAAGCTGLNLASLTTATGTSATIAGQATEYDTRDHILNRIVTVTAGVPSGYQAASTTWDVTSLATQWGAPP